MERTFELMERRDGDGWLLRLIAALTKRNPAEIRRSLVARGEPGTMSVLTRSKTRGAWTMGGTSTPASCSQ
jgi:hypothetical protein